MKIDHKKIGEAASASLAALEQSRGAAMRFAAVNRSMQEHGEPVATDDMPALRRELRRVLDRLSHARDQIVKIDMHVNGGVPL